MQVVDLLGDYATLISTTRATAPGAERVLSGLFCLIFTTRAEIQRAGHHSTAAVADRLSRPREADVLHRSGEQVNRLGSLTAPREFISVVEVFTSPDGQCVVTVMDQAARVWCVGSPICLSRASGVASRKVCMGVFPECCFQGRETQADQSALAASLVRFSRMFRCLDVHGAEPFICSRCAISCRIVPSVLVRITFRRRAAAVEFVRQCRPRNAPHSLIRHCQRQFNPANTGRLRLCNRCL